VSTPFGMLSTTFKKMIWTKKDVRTADVFRAASAVWGISKDDLVARNRVDRIVKMRWIVFAIMQETGVGIPQIAEEFKVCTSTVVYGLERHIELTDEEYIENSEAVRELHNKYVHGFDLHPNTSEDSYVERPNYIIDRKLTPNAGGFTDFDADTGTFHTLQ